MSHCATIYIELRVLLARLPKSSARPATRFVPALTSRHVGCAHLHHWLHFLESWTNFALSVSRPHTVLRMGRSGHTAGGYQTTRRELRGDYPTTFGDFSVPASIGCENLLLNLSRMPTELIDRLQRAEPAFADCGSQCPKHHCTCAMQCSSTNRCRCSKVIDPATAVAHPERMAPPRSEERCQRISPPLS